ncbi:hypothetical protein COLO4_04428 [Corchorus olitorius]|uniref:Uncharacterized protein n=1 Tax=Corchorus olitorius TaxID=93759 RepID=A0A1R3KU35_9ROSI|nr:hypothetical protein COLO4_04428 [Corchorus olitorius]
MGTGLRAGKQDSSNSVGMYLKDTSSHTHGWQNQGSDTMSAKHERARRRKVQTLRPNGNEQHGNEQRRNDKMRCSGHPHLEVRVEGFGPVAFPVPPSSGGACVGDMPPEIGLEAIALPTSRQLMAMSVGHDYYQKAPMRMNISHGGVCICMLGVLLSCDLAAYVRPVAHASYLFRAGGVNSDSIRPRCSETPSTDHTERHESAGNASWRSGVKHPYRYEKRGRDDIIYVRTAPRGVDPASDQVFDQGTGEFPLPQAGQPGRERGGNGLPKKPAPDRGQHRMKGTALMLCWKSQLLGLRA